MNETQIIDNNFELIAIQEKHNVERERFVRGVIFSEELVNGTSASEAYAMSFEVTKYEAQTRSANFRNSKWVQELILYFKPDENTLYFGEIRQIIRKGMNIIDDPMSEPRDIISAMNALAKYIKTTKTNQEQEEKLSSDATKMIAGLMEGIAQLASSDRMINKHGQIIDVPILK